MPAKIAVLVRTRNEESNIEAFCASYAWANYILVADGSSTDRTVELAEKFRNVRVRDYPVRVQMENGLWRNPHGPHINFLIDWANFDFAPDWLIFTDCDERPSRSLKVAGRMLLETTDKHHIYLPLVHIWGTDRYFPQLSQPGGPGQWGKVPWAWRKGHGIRYRADHPEHLQEPIRKPSPEDVLYLDPPYCQLHFGWTTPEVAQRKVDFYRNSGQIPTMLHPLEFGGPLEPLLEWMVE